MIELCHTDSDGWLAVDLHLARGRERWLHARVKLDAGTDLVVNGSVIAWHDPETGMGRLLNPAGGPRPFHGE